MRIGVAIWLALVVETSKIFFDEQMNARLGMRLHADLSAFGPLRHHMRRDCRAYGLAVESDGERPSVERAFQQIKQLLPGRKLNERFDTSPLAQLSDFLLRETQAQRVSLNAKFHRRHSNPRMRWLPAYMLKRLFVPRETDQRHARSFRGGDSQAGRRSYGGHEWNAGH